MILFIAEKPELARAIVAGLGGGHKKGSYYDCGGGNIVTWCVGHLLELAKPKDYDPKYEAWDLQNLPFYYYPIKLKPSGDAKLKKHTKVVVSLIERAKTVVHAGDPDREGQLIVDQILSYANFRGKVLRFSTNDNSEMVVKKALNNLEPNNKYKGLSDAGKARQIADQLYGFNMTMAMTSMFKEQGGYEVISIGRVKTPILSLIVNRTLANKNHKAAFYYTLSGKDESGLKFAFKPDDLFIKNDKGHLTEKNQADKIFQSIKGQSLVLKDLTEKQKTKKAPLPFNMINLQIECAKKLGMSPEQVSKATQTLREKHSLITYNGTDCCYLNDNHHQEAPGVFKAVFNYLKGLNNDSHDFNIRGRCFNDNKVTAHHAIIPTSNSKSDFGELSKSCREVYKIIAQRYLIQFYPAAEFCEKKLFAKIDQYEFLAVSKFCTKISFLQYTDPKINQDDLIEKYNVGDKVTVPFQLNNEKTAPPKLYTFETLLRDLTQVSKYIKNEKLKEILIAKDDGLEGERGGIGTPRTRDKLIASVLKSDFAAKKKNTLLATDKGIKFIKQLPESITQPDMTALWHEQLTMIESGELDVKEFLDYVFSFINQQITIYKSDGFRFDVLTHPCPDCSGLLKRLFSKARQNHFWACATGDCDFTCSDSKKQPVF